MERFSDSKIEQVERIVALLHNATYPGDGMWRFKTACEMVARGAAAEVEHGDLDVSNCTWFAASVKILAMESANGLHGWSCFTPKEQTEVVAAFLPAAKALVRWVNAIRKDDAREQECDWRDIGFMDTAPESVILEKLNGYGRGPSEKLLRNLLFTENYRREIIYNSLFFKQLNFGLDTDGEYLDYVDPVDPADIEECNAVIRTLYEARAAREGRKDAPIPTLPEKNLQAIMEDLSESNEPFLERERQENAELCRQVDERIKRLGGNHSLFPTTVANPLSAAVRPAMPDAPSPSSPSVRDEPPTRKETIGRFVVERSDAMMRVMDTQNEKRYEIGRSTGNAAKAVMTLIRDYAAGNRQVHDSSREWKGAMQPGRGDATHFKEEQIFMLPKWNVEKQRYLNGQYCGKWRLWTDEEMKLPVAKRLANYKAEFPHGQAWDG